MKSFALIVVVVLISGCTVVEKPRYIAQTMPYGTQTFDCTESVDSECQDLFRQFKVRQSI
jgi:hypothetical protein